MSGPLGLHGDVCQDIAQLHTSLQHDIKRPDKPGVFCLFRFQVDVILCFSSTTVTTNMFNWLGT